MKVYKVYSTARKSSIFLTLSLLSFITIGLTTLSNIVEKAKSAQKKLLVKSCYKKLPHWERQ